jgi:hypothetical protein
MHHEAWDSTSDTGPPIGDTHGFTRRPLHHRRVTGSKEQNVYFDNTGRAA